MKFIIGKKLDMTQIWKDDKVLAVTRVQAGPCVATQIKTEEKDKYTSVQLGFGERKEKNINKAQKGHTKGLGNFAKMREFRLEIEEAANLKKGDKIDVGTFEAGDKVKVSGISKGRGFQGVVKRYGFAGQDKTHGNKDQLRMPGSIGATGPAHVFKGQKMPGRMGGDNVTVSNLEIVEIDKENNILFIKGAVPGARNGLVLIKGNGEFKLASKEEKKESKEKGKDKEMKEEKAEKKEVVEVEKKEESNNEKK